MKIKLIPKAQLGRWSCGLIGAFFIFLGLFFVFCSLGEKGGNTFFSNLKLAVPHSMAAISGIFSFITGTLSIIRNKEKSILVFLSIVAGFLVLLWILSEIVFPH